MKSLKGETSIRSKHYEISESSFVFSIDRQPPVMVTIGSSWNTTGANLRLRVRAQGS